MELKKRLGQRIRNLRIATNLKQHELAEIVGITAKTQSCIERGINYPKAEQIEKYAKAFKVNVAEILYIGEIEKVEKDYKSALESIIKNATKKQLEYIYKHASLVIKM